VWASLWNYRAWEEREYYGIDHTAADMAILVTPAFPDELVNGVAFTGNPADPTSQALLVNSQVGDTSVVSPDPGVLPERVLLRVADGGVTDIVRFQGSSLLPEGAQVLSDEQLLALADILLGAAEHTADFVPGADPESALLDIEFKVRRGDEALIVKQIRPFLPQPTSAGRVLRPFVPAELTLCAGWHESEDLRSVLENKAVAELHSGSHQIMLDEAQSNHDVLGDLRFGRELAAAEPLGEGTVVVAPDEARPGFANVELSRTYVQGDDELEVRLLLLGIPTTGYVVRRLDAEAILGYDVVATIRLAGEDVPRPLNPCPLPGTTLNRLHLAFDGAQSADLFVRYGRAAGSSADASAVDVVSAAVKLAGGDAEATSYQRLVYSAARHNWRERIWALFETPIGDAHGLGVYQIGEGRGGEDYRAELLDSDLKSLRDLPISAVVRTQVTATPGATPPTSTGTIYLPSLLLQP
jgi:hypothetical protein